MRRSHELPTKGFVLEDKPYHFIGIGGIGMSALARIALELGYTVSGSDLRDTPILEELRSSGATIFIGQRYEQIQDDHIVVFSSDIRSDNPEMKAAQEKGVQLLHRSDLLSALTQVKKTLLIAGSHGKTSTTGLLTHVLRTSGFNPNFALGGLLRGIDSNGLATESEYFVVEADESDGTFVKYQGCGAIITNINDDHLSHYGSMDALRKAFQQFSTSIDGCIAYCIDDPELEQLGIQGVPYGFSEKAIVRASNLRQFPGKVIFDITYNGTCYKDIEVKGFGKHTALNALGVFTLALYVGCDLHGILSGLKTFPGVQRRLQVLFSEDCVTLFDDYGHHPHEITTTLKALKESYPDERIIAVFEPHRYSRMHSVMHKLEDAFLDADIVIATDIHAAGEAPIAGVTIEAIIDIMKKKQNVHYEPKSTVVSYVYETIRPHDIVIFFGAGENTKRAHALGAHLREKSVKPLRVGMLYGSKSVEHNISAISLQFFIHNIAKRLYTVDTFYIDVDGHWHYEPVPFSSYKKKEEKIISHEVLEKLLACDIIFPILHGAYGEDGIFQGFLEVLEKPYIGCSFQASMLSMDKAYAKEIARSAGVPILEYTVVTSIKEDFTKVSYPAFVKPAHLGSSIGVKRVETPEELKKAVEEALQYDTKVLIERAVKNPIELEVALITEGDSIKASLPGELLTNGKVYDFKEKYSSNGVQARAIAEVATKILQKVQEYAKTVYKAIGCDGFSRVDFLLEGEEIFFNEANPIPGCTENSLYPKMMEKSGGYTKEGLIDQFVRVGLKRFRDQKKRLSHTKALIQELEHTIE